MPASSPIIRAAAAKYGGLAKNRPTDDPERVAAGSDLLAARLEDYIAKTVAGAPPLTDGQRVRLTLLLNGGAA